MMPPEKCGACQGVGFTRWAAFVTGLGNLLGALVGTTNRPWPCSSCRGTGLSDTDIEDRIWKRMVDAHPEIENLVLEVEDEASDE